jgi:chromosome segregation ATPase
MSRFLVERRLRTVSKRLRSLRAELTVVDEQLAQLVDEADDASIRALVSDNAGVGPEAREAKAHADAMRSHRAHLVATIADLEARQDELLDQLGGSPA